MLKIYTVKDLVSKTCNNPMTFATDRDALEGFKHVSNQEDTQFNKFPNDYELYFIGEYDSRHGQLELRDHKRLASAAEVITKTEK